MRKQLGSASRIVLPEHGLSFARSGHLWLPDRDFAPAGQLPRLLIPPLDGAFAAGWVDGEEQDILEEWAAATARPNVASHVGLFTTTPNDAGAGGVEVAAGDYGRQLFARNGTNWGSSVAGAPSTIENLLAITWTKATSNWGTVTSWTYHTAITAGVLLLFAVLDTAKAINTDDTAELAVGDAKIQLGDPGDTF